ncbi:alpha/beta fold hydrolase [Gracilibacillus alcaliphilus]|uniref:alpha/beta fold hydrolase n=1 Tax=Gracilibacillus alcaliphilus TaxID=1401441 RepID=UPI00195A16DC|nr:alpha/beta fold hydrolase [Gracilibacillus alcaliphilus]MBM7675268.1 pimeloyl-ACP methyl ester carboxylesterase [Gracilibacillus alcaliphilus]
MIRGLLIITILLIVAGCSNDTENVGTKSEDILKLLESESYQELTETYFSNSLQERLSPEELQENWEAVRGQTLVSFSALESDTRQDYTIMEAEASFEEKVVHIRMTWDQQDKLQGLHIQAEQNLAEERPLPDQVIEEDILINTGGSYELAGKLTLPEKTEQPIPAVVLVHGSGPSDMNEAVFAYKPFQDFAYSLAEQEIAVLRYPKRTYEYAEELVAEFGNELTVKEETIDDAVAAIHLLQADPRIGQVYIIGHSLGGMLAPRIDQQADTDGMVILAGSPRFLWEIIYDQQMAVIPENLAEEEKQAYMQEIEETKELAASMQDLTDTEAIKHNVYGVSGYYLKEMASYDAGQMALDSNKPIFILQGEADFQVTMEADFSQWQTKLGDQPNAALKSYPNLNHFFIESQGEHQGTVTEYMTPGHVDEQVILDIAAWIHEQSENMEEDTE